MNCFDCRQTQSCPYLFICWNMCPSSMLSAATLSRAQQSCSLAIVRGSLSKWHYWTLLLTPAVQGEPAAAAAAAVAAAAAHHSISINTWAWSDLDLDLELGHEVHGFRQMPPWDGWARQCIEFHQSCTLFLWLLNQGKLFCNKGPVRKNWPNFWFL